MSWVTVQLGDFITLKRGYDLPERARVAGNIPIVSSSGVTGTHNEAKVDGPGVVTGRYGTLGEVFYIDEPFWPLNTALYVQDFKGNQRRFVSYFLKSILSGIQSDKAAVPGVNRNDLHARNVLVTNDLQEQATIASILSAYDNLIENNRRRIQLLEESARLLYKEWFVRLRFPGHEHVKVVDGVPEGWESTTLTELADDVSYGLTAPSTNEKVGPKFLRITDIVPDVIDWENVPYCKADEKDIVRNRLQPGDVVVARTGATVGYAKLITTLHHEAVYASYLVRFKFNDSNISTIAGVYMESDMYKEYVKNHAGGAAQPNANAKILGSATIFLPAESIRKQFGEKMTTIFKQKDFLIQQNGLLAQARDLLLPRLMSGEVAV